MSLDAKVKASPAASIVSAKPEDEEASGKKEDGGSGKGRLHVVSAPEGAHQEAGNEVAHGIDRRQGAKGHAMLLLRNEFGGKGIFQRFLRADV